MEIKEIGGAVVLLCGGAIYGVSQMGLGDMLSEDVKHISEVPLQERTTYMTSVIEELNSVGAEFYAATDTSYLYQGLSTFSISSNSTFKEVVRQEQPVPDSEMQGLKTTFADSGFCNQAEMLMFTENGWTYRFHVVEGKGRQIYSVTCSPAVEAPQQPQLRGLS